MSMLILTDLYVVAMAVDNAVAVKTLQILKCGCFTNIIILAAAEDL